MVADSETCLQFCVAGVQRLSLHVLDRSFSEGSVVPHGEKVMGSTNSAVCAVFVWHAGGSSEMVSDCLMAIDVFFLWLEMLDAV